MHTYYFTTPKATNPISKLLNVIEKSSYKENSKALDCIVILKIIAEYGPKIITLSEEQINVIRRIENDIKQCKCDLSADIIFEKLYAFLSNYVKELQLSIDGKNVNDKFIIYNSANYYDKEIKNIEKEKSNLLQQISELKKKQTKTETEAQEHKDALMQKEKELDKYIKLTEKYEAERKEQDKINDAIAVWDNKIKIAFGTLKTYIKPIKSEHFRLCLLYWFYLGLSVVLIICLAIIEYNICTKIINFNGLPTWETYFSVILPIPISLALLWGFIHEMNRAQRQLVILAKQIHEIEYVEGLLLTINMLSTDINESMSRVNSAINKLLENHLSYKDNTLNDEVLLKKEEHKDLAPHEETLKILKEVNELIANRK